MKTAPDRSPLRVKIKPKKLLFIALAATAWLVSASAAGAPPRSLFVSVIQDPPVLSSRAQIERLIDFSRRAGVKTLFVQVYRANRAWFRSSVADDSPYRECRAAVGEDAFAFLIKEAHAEGLEVHAWLNLLSLSANERAPILERNGPGILARNREEKRALSDYRIDDQYFLEPGDPRVRETLETVVGEVAAAYPDLDGIQFDYVRYPDVHPDYGYAESNVARFRAATGLDRFEKDDPRWIAWKREQVTSLVRELAAKARLANPRLQVSTTGLMPYSRALLESCQDWREWLSEPGVDFVTLMCYTKDPALYARYLADARRQAPDLSRVRIAVGAYMLVGRPREFGKQLELAERSGASGAAILHYGNFLENHALSAPLGAGPPRDNEPGVWENLRRRFVSLVK